jgi:hypothetical protein
MLSDILLEKMQAAPAFQEDDGDGDDFAMRRSAPPAIRILPAS